MKASLLNAVVKSISTVLVCLSISVNNSYAITDALKIKIAIGSYSDETIIRFVAGATNGFDGSYDAWKLFSGNTAVPNIFSKDNVGDKLTINAMPEFSTSLSVDVFLRIGSVSTYSVTPEEIGAFAPGVSILMKDLITGQVYDMRSATTYSINLPLIAQTDSARFRVFFSYPNNNPVVLPITFEEFSASPIGSIVHISWNTSSETNSDFFTVERSKEGTYFEEIERINAAGNSSTNSNYASTDENPYKGTSYYRIKETDKNGTAFYSKTVSVTIEKKNKVRVFPNPASDFLYVNISGSKGIESKMVIRDVLGKECYSQKLIPESDDETIRVNFSTVFSCGSYFVVVSNEENSSEKKIIIK